MSCRELDAGVDVAWTTEGVVGARMTGGGFGGSVVALVAAHAVDELRGRIDRELSEEVGTEVNPRTFVCGSADGVRLERP